MVDVMQLEGAGTPNFLLPLFVFGLFFLIIVAWWLRIRIIKNAVWIVVLYFPFLIAGVALDLHLYYNPPYGEPFDPLSALFFFVPFGLPMVLILIPFYPYLAIPIVLYYLFVYKCRSTIRRVVAYLERLGKS
jgi:hypothetical protein